MVDALIEIPYNSFVKYEFDKKSNKMRCDRILNTSMLYPGNYGYIDNTLADDGDALDILVICDYPLYPGTIINTKVIGVLIMTDEKGIDEKIIAVPSHEVDQNFESVNDITDLPKYTLNKIKHFFEHYKDNEENKWVKVDKFEGKKVALQLILDYRI